MSDVSAVADTGNVKQIDKSVNKINQSTKTKKYPPPPPPKKKKTNNNNIEFSSAREINP